MYALSSLDGRKRLLLETDSSYLADYPWDVIKVAEEVAWSLDMTLTELVGVCNKNAAWLYETAISGNRLCCIVHVICLLGTNTFHFIITDSEVHLTVSCNCTFTVELVDAFVAAYP